MNERSAGILIQLILTINIVTAQIQFIDNYPSVQRARSAQNYVPNVNSQTQAQQRGQRSTTVQSPTTYKENSYEQYIASAVSQGFTKLTLDVNRITQAVSPDIAQADYVVYGPLTITGALGLVLLASIGETFDEIANCVGLSSLLNNQESPLYTQFKVGKLLDKVDSKTTFDIGHHVNFATAIFVQRDFPVRPAFLEITNTYYKGDVINLDFLGNPQNAKHIINTWVSGRTNRKIPTLLDEPPPSETTAIIASVLYFQAKWQFPFFNGHTKLHAFYSNGRKKPSTRMVEMMSNGGDFPYYKDRNLGAEIMGFPYEGNKTTMYVIIPFESNTEKLRQLENSLTHADIEHLVDNTRYTETVILFPKMKLETTVNLRNTLQMMGVKSLFDPAKANLALLSPGVNQRFNEANEAPFVSAPISNQNQVYQSFAQEQSSSTFNRKQNRRPVTTEAPQQSSSTFNRQQNHRPATTEVLQQNLEERLIFNRFNEEANCTPVYDPASGISKCHVNLHTYLHQIQRQNRALPRSAREETTDHNPIEELEKIRQQVLQSPIYANPGLYADQVIHKVYIDITESGTEAAAATGISLNRSGGRVTFRVDVPFLFFIYHEDSRLILFWGSVKTPPAT